MVEEELLLTIFGLTLVVIIILGVVIELFFFFETRWLVRERFEDK